MRLGVLMLDTRFDRFVGDIGNPQSYDEPVLFEVVRDATIDKVVPAKAPPLIEDFVAAGERLIGRGADAITTGCGCLMLNQAELAARLQLAREVHHSGTKRARSTSRTRRPSTAATIASSARRGPLRAQQVVELAKSPRLMKT